MKLPKYLTNPITPMTTIRAALRLLDLRSRERQHAMYLANRTCVWCDKHASSKVKLNAHHRRPPNWKRIETVIREELLQTSHDYDILCEECHTTHHREEQ